jgi:hypothetical protein
MRIRKPLSPLVPTIRLSLLTTYTHTVRSSFPVLSALRPNDTVVYYGTVRSFPMLVPIELPLFNSGINTERVRSCKAERPSSSLTACLRAVSSEPIHFLHRTHSNTVMEHAVTPFLPSIRATGHLACLNSETNQLSPLGIKLTDGYICDHAHEYPDWKLQQGLLDIWGVMVDESWVAQRKIELGVHV